MRRLLLLTIALHLTASPTTAALVFDWASVGNPGNANDSTGFGSVDYGYRISKHEVTNNQYVDFLNKVAVTDTNALFNVNMDITRQGSTGSYSYTVNSGFENRPTTWVSYFNAMRFTNWLENGQPVGSQGPTTTEAGVYSIGPTGLTETRAAGATYFIPTENEWYKAAYYDPRTAAEGGPAGNDHYWAYPTQTDSAPIAEAPAGGANSGNFFHIVGETTDVGAYSGAASFYGTFDQAGNLWEWNETLIDPVNRGVRGAGWSSYEYLSGAATQGGGGPDVEKFKIGFRVATVPEPSSLLYGCVVILGLFLSKKRFPN